MGIDESRPHGFSFWFSCLILQKTMIHWLNLVQSTPKIISLHPKKHWKKDLLELLFMLFFNLMFIGFCCFITWDKIENMLFMVSYCFIQWFFFLVFDVGLKFWRSLWSRSFLVMIMIKNLICLKPKKLDDFEINKWCSRPIFFMVSFEIRSNSWASNNPFNEN